MTHALQYFRPTQALVDLQALVHNVNLLRQSFGTSKFFCPMVKANAYGHGDVEISRTLEKLGVAILGVGLIEEGELLRQMGVTADVLVFGMWETRGANTLLRHRLTPVINDLHQLQTWMQAVQAVSAYSPTTVAPAPQTAVHLKFDTGMHRLGFRPDEAATCFEVCRMSRAQVAGVLTHLHSAEDLHHAEGTSQAQLRLLVSLADVFSAWQPEIHALNSAGLLHGLSLRNLDLLKVMGARPGLALYGYAPTPELAQVLPLKPVMTLRSQIVRIHDVAVGEGVSYGQTWKAQRPSKVGVVPIGYADGYHRSLSNRGQVLFLGHRVPVVGNVCMDYLMLDLTEVLKDRPVESLMGRDWDVTLLGTDAQGNRIGAEEIAVWAGTAVWEILTSIGERVPRVYLPPLEGYTQGQRTDL